MEELASAIALDGANYVYLSVVHHFSFDDLKG
jgi:hypothetical protein